MDKEKAISIAMDAAEIAAKTALSTIPVGGTLFAGVWDAIKSNAADKRLKEWQYLIEERLSKIDATLEDVASNENFTSAMFQATEIALKTSQKEKRDYLANAVVNALTCPMEESILMMFLSMVDKYTFWHLKILAYFQNPRRFDGVDENKYFMGSPKIFLFEVYPELRQQEMYVDKIVKELFTDGLMNIENLNVSMTSSGMVDSRVTEMGSDFINFISR